MEPAHQVDEAARRDDVDGTLAAGAEAMLANLGASLLNQFLTAPGASGPSSESADSTAAELNLRYRTLLEQIPAVVFMARLEDGHGEAYVSPHIEAMLGFSREEWLDDPIRWFNQIHPEDRNRWSIEAAAFIVSGKPFRSVYRVLARDGHVVWFQCEAKMVRRPNGQPWFIHGVGIDVTDLKNAEQQLQRARDELELRVQERTAELLKTNAELESEIAQRERIERNLERRAEELARSNADLEQFAYSASHDLQEPIRNVAISAQLLDREHSGALGPEGQALLNTVITSAQYMENLIHDLLEYTRVARAAGEFESADANRVIEQVVRGLENIIRENDAEITWNSLPSVGLPAVRLQQLFLNLISNAIKYRSPEPPCIHVSAELVSDSWVFSVEDNGIGIDPKYHERIFGIFKRLHSKRQYPGTGIGLAICKRIVQHVGGKIWVESEPGKGARFRFTIPAEQRSVAAPHAAAT